MILAEGDCLLVVYRRLFEFDHGRMFIGNVDGYQDGIVRITGFTIARDAEDSDYCLKAQKQTKLFALASGTLITYVLPREFSVDQARVQANELELLLTDDQGHDLDISEWFRKS